MSVIDKLSSSLKRRDELPNQELAKAIADSNDKKSIEELLKNLKNKKQSRCCKFF